MPYSICQALPADFPAINRLRLEAYEEFAPTLELAGWEPMSEAPAHASGLSNAGEWLLAEDVTGLLGLVLIRAAGKVRMH